MLSATTTRILGLIAEGRSYDQILHQHPELTYFDIFAAAREALDLAQGTGIHPVDSGDARQPEPPTLVEIAPLQPVAWAPAEPETEAPEQPPRRMSFVERARAQHSRAFARWSREEDERLERLFRAGTPRSEIVRQLDRHNGAIVRRLQKLGLIEGHDESPSRTRRDRRPPAEGRTLEPVDVADSDPPQDRPLVPGWEVFRDRLHDDRDHD